MQLLNPDVIAEARGLSPAASGFVLFVGFLLWALGWRWHRFWIVFAITLSAGILGLGAGQSAGVQILVVGVLCAVAAGMLAIELARLLAFLTGGVAAWVGATMVAPGAQELWAVFLCGGLIGVVLHKLWTMLAMSLLGILLCWHTLLAMSEGPFGWDAAKWAGENASALNGAVLAGTLLGVVVQTRTARDAPVGEEGGKGEKPAKGGDLSDSLGAWLKRILPARMA